MSKVEVFLDHDQIQNLKQILNQSEFGVHLLFERSMISDTFKEEISEDAFFEMENIKRIQEDMVCLLKIKRLNDKKDFIRNLTFDRQKGIIRAYFYIVENNAQQSQKFKH